METFQCQKEAISNLTDYAATDKHSIIISGPEGCGKTYLAKQYANMKGISDFQVLSPTVNELRESIDICSNIESEVVLCVENLDLGVFAASSVLLKFLEEPNRNVYIIITARNMKYIPDTIISRSQPVCISPPIKSDLEQYAKINYPSLYETYNKYNLWNCIHTFTDIDTVMEMDISSLQYIEVLPAEILKLNCVADTVWALNKYPNKADTPINLVIRYIIYTYPQLLVEGIECIQCLSQKRLGVFAILNKFVFNLRYKLGLKI